MSATEQIEGSSQMQTETEIQVENVENTTQNDKPSSVPKSFKVISSYEIDKSFEKNIVIKLSKKNFEKIFLNKQAKVQQDFIKNINVYEDGKYIYGLTEQMNLKLFSFDESQEQIKEVLSKKFPQPLYDSMMIKNKSNQDIIVVSIKNQPINIYKLENKSETMLDEQTEQKLYLKNVGYLTSQKKNTELYQTPLQFKYDDNKKTLFGAGKQFVINYDLNKFSIKETYEKFNKSDILSCFDIPNPNSTDYQTYSDIVAFGKFDRKIEILDFKQKKIVNSFSLHLGGITCLKFDPQNSNYLYSGARKDDLIYLWDLRKQDTFVHFYQRKCTTNQRMSFDILSNFIAYGHQTGEITLADTASKQTILNENIHEDCVNSVKLFERNQKLYCLSAAGQRHYNICEESESDSNEESSEDEVDMMIEKSEENKSLNIPKKVNKQIAKKEKKPHLFKNSDNSIKVSLLDN